MEEPLRKLLQLAEMLSDTKILLDFDNYNGSLSYYRYVKFLAVRNQVELPLNQVELVRNQDELPLNQVEPVRNQVEPVQNLSQSPINREKVIFSL